MNATSNTATTAQLENSPLANPWVQLIIGIICMVMIANLQYGWTLFVGPINEKYHWGKASIQVAFTIFVCLGDLARAYRGMAGRQVRPSLDHGHRRRACAASPGRSIR